MHKTALKTMLFFLWLLFSGVLPVSAQPEKESTTLAMFYNDDDIVVTPTRYPKSISRVAENLTIITAEQIQAINAHTVADVLNNVTGIQLIVRGGPGSTSDALIQGSAARHVLVMIDGVSQNALSEGSADVGIIPVQKIDRIEIVKGPASSAWGSSLGGVINIITKSPDDTRKVGGTISASIGERNTGDYRGEASGEVGRVGYYLSGGGLISDGLVVHNSIYSGNMYTKLHLTPTDNMDLGFTFGYNAGSRGIGESQSFDLSFDNTFEHLFSTLSLNYLLSNDLSLDISLQAARRETKIFYNQLSTGIRIDGLTRTAEDAEFGGNTRLTWTQKLHQMAVGVDFNFAELDSNVFLNGTQHLDKWAFFTNDTITLGRFSLIPGVRYDYTSTNGDFLSPSMGGTCTIGENTILRAYVARGFTIPPLGFTNGESLFFSGNPNLKMETVWSYAAGFETAALHFLWLKTMFFRHDIDDILSSEILPSGFFTYANSRKQRRQGVETEVKTIPVYHTSLFAGYAFVDATDRITGEDIPSVARYTFDVGLQYDDRKSLQGSLKGHYIRWHVNPGDNGRYSAMVWDLNVAKKVIAEENNTATIFFTAHNIFNGAQYAIAPFKNPRRWFEGGVRFDF